MNRRGDRLGFLALLPFILSGLFAQPRSNQAVLADLLSRATLEQIKTVATPGDTLSIRYNRQDTRSVWAGIILTDSCLAGNYLVYSTPEEAAHLKAVVEVDNVSATVAYQTAARNWMGRSRAWQRSVSLTFHLLVSNAEGKVVFSGPIEKALSDTLTREQLRVAEQGAPEFVRGTISENGLIKRWLEPGLVIGATAVVVYLFYALRSD